MIFVRALIWFIWFAFSASVLATESRTALVIGNRAYEHARQLVNPGNDAAAISLKLRTLGFSVIERHDISLKEMRVALREFVRSIPREGVAFVYYAGHGVQIRGSNYLVPVDANMAEEFEVPDETMSMDTVMRAMELAGGSLNIIVLDCCRDDPYSRSWRGSRSTSGGAGLVMPADNPRGMFVAYATSPGKVADDGNGKHSPYAAALLEELDKPGVDFEKVFKNVGAKVVNATGGKQEPWFNSKFYGTFCFRMAPQAVSKSAAVPPEASSHNQEANSPPPQAEFSAGVVERTPPPFAVFDLGKLFSASPYKGVSVASRTEVLKRAQSRLKLNGFYSGQVDGTPGLATQKGIISWQEHSFLKQSGILDLPTLKSLGLEGTAPLGDAKERAGKKESIRSPKPQAPLSPAEKPNPERGNMSVEEFIRRAKALENQ
jgi:hypothetical protein